MIVNEDVVSSSVQRILCVCVKERGTFYPNSIFTTYMQIINLINRLYIIFIKLVYCTNSVYIDEYKVYSLLGNIFKKYKLYFES